MYQRHGDVDLPLHRKNIYRLLAEPFRFPDEATAANFADGSWGRQIGNAANGLGFPVPGIETHGLSADYRAYREQFIALHEVGMGGAPCPLHSGHHERDRMRALEEVVRFYRYFDYQPGRTPDRFPDHLTFELEFMVHLVEGQMEAQKLRGDAASPLRAQKDFMERHLASWLPELEVQVRKRSSLSFCAQVTQLLNRFVAYDLDHIRRQVRQLELPVAGQISGQTPGQTREHPRGNSRRQSGGHPHG